MIEIELHLFVAKLGQDSHGRRNTLQNLLKGVVAVMFASIVVVLPMAFVLGANKEWGIVHGLLWAIVVLILAIYIISPFTLRREGESYFHVLRKYFF